MDSTEKNKIRANNIRAVWDALLAPSWNKDELIELGKAIYARRALKDLDAKQFDKLLPHLSAIVERLESKFTIPAAPEISPPTDTNTTITPPAAPPVKE